MLAATLSLGQSPSTFYRWGGIQAYWLDEGTSVVLHGTEVIIPQVRLTDIRLKKLVALTDNLLDDIRRKERRSRGLHIEAI